MSVITTPGAANANSYCSEAEADRYHETHVSSADWEDAEGDKEAALIMATRLLDQWFDWNGTTASATQALLWPRSGVIGPSGYLLPSALIPDRVRDATAELARQLIAADRTADSDADAQGLKSLKVGPVELAFKENATSKPIPDAVIGFVGCLGQLRGKSGGTVTLRRA